MAAQLNQLWDPARSGSFHDISKRLDALILRIDRSHRESNSTLTRIIESNAQHFYSDLETRWKTFKGHLDHLRKVEKLFTPIDNILTHTISEIVTEPGRDGVIAKPDGLFMENHRVASTRLKDLRTRVQKIFEDHLYRWFLDLRSAEKRWSPNALLTTGLNYLIYSFTKNPRREIEAFCPQDEFY